MPVRTICALLLSIALVGCHTERPAGGGGKSGGSCRVEPQPLRAKSTVRSRSRRSESLDVPARGPDAARNLETLEEREDTTTLIEVDGTTVRRAAIEITLHRLRNLDGKMVSGPLHGIVAELTGDAESVAVHPIGAPLDADSTKRLADLFRYIGKPHPFLAIGPQTVAIGARSEAYEKAIARWMRRDEPDASGHAPEVSTMLTRCDAQSANFAVHFRIVGKQLGWDIEGRVDGTLVVARKDGRPTHVVLRSTFTGKAPDAAGAMTGKGEQNVEYEYE